MNDQQLDEQITRAVRALAETSPEPLPLAAATPQHRSPRPILVFAGAFAAVALIAGLVAVLPRIGRIAPFGSTGPADTAVPTTMEEYWTWLTDGGLVLEDNPDVVLVRRPPPGTRFDPREYGEPQRILPVSSGDNPLWDVATANFPGRPRQLTPPVALIGTLEGSGMQVAALRGVDFTEEPALCVQFAGDELVSSICGPLELDALNGARLSILAQTPGDRSSPEASFLFFGPLPWDTALVVIRLDDGRRYVQQPRAGMALFRIPGPTALIGTASALDADAGTIVEERFNIGP
ncbi:MAG: hypothetical protein GXP36_00015 [Actinobacteria bacterium]|nr:hypothetical protein [Actinomycetota bacterium]